MLWLVGAVLRSLALHSFTLSLCTDAIEVLATEGNSNINHQDPFGFTALHWAVLNNHPKATLLLLSLGADPNITTNCNTTPLMTAAMQGSVELINILTHEGNADTRLKNKRGETALHVAWDQDANTRLREIEQQAVHEKEAVTLASRLKSWMFGWK